MESGITWIGTLIVLLSAISTGLGVSPNDLGQDEASTIEVTDNEGVVYSIRYVEEQSKVIIEYKSGTKRNNDLTGYVLEVDGKEIADKSIRLDIGDKGKYSHNITSGVDVTRDYHTISFSTLGNSTYINFTRRINPRNANQIPRTHIENVSVRNNTNGGKYATVADITLANPSDQIYSTKLFVHTTETDGRHRAASVPPGGTRTITVKLNEERGAKVAGEVRLFTGNFTSKEGAFDQVEFVGQAGKSTSSWNQSYETVRPTWMDDHYQYENDSVRQSFGEKVSGGHEVKSIPIVYLVAALLGAALAVVKFR